MKSLLKYIAVFLALQAGAQSLSSPQIRCVDVLQPTGNAKVTWVIPNDPLNEFKSYEVFYASSLGGPYTNMASISSLPTNTATCFTCNANLQAYFFFVCVKTQANNLLPAIDTVKSIFLLQNAPPLSPLAKLQWSDFKFPLPSGLSSSYNVWREYPAGTWTIIKTVPTNTTNLLANYYYVDTISICQDSIHYKVELTDPVLGCSSFSSIKGNVFTDKTPPAPPSLDSVSVDNNGKAVIAVGPSYSQDVIAFVIYLYTTGGGYIPIDTLYTNNTSVVYTYLSSLANANSEQYSVAALDSCGNISQIASNDQNTIKITVVYNICGKSANITWNSYQNMKGGLDHYEILCSVNAGAYVHLADTNALSYKHRGLANGNTYCYLVRAHNATNTVTSTSNKFCIIPAVGNTPNYVYLSKVSVINPTEKVDVEWTIDNAVRVGGFEVFHAANYAGPYSSVGTVYATGASNYSFTDLYADAAQQKFYYKVLVLDTCMNPLMKTDTSNTIHLSAYPSGNLTATLNWNNYAVWLGGVSGYNIYRSQDNVFSAAPVATAGPGTFSYVDDVSSLADYSGKFTYYVEAVEGSGNPYGITATSESNYADVYIDASLYVPNAFVPKGHNKILIPVGNYIDKVDYKFMIFDRWGEKVFETTDNSQGWDGGSYEEGIYAYLIQYKTSIGEFREQKGTIMLVR